MTYIPYLVGRRGDGQHGEALHGVDDVHDRVLAAGRVLPASLKYSKSKVKGNTAVQ